MGNFVTEQQEAFISAFAEAVKGGLPKEEALRAAKTAAGYHETYSIPQILKHLGPAWVEFANRELNLAIPEAIDGIISVLRDPESRGGTNKLAAAASLLDRAGIGKKETKDINISMPTGIAIMPPKVPVVIDEDVTAE